MMYIPERRLPEPRRVQILQISAPLILEMIRDNLTPAGWYISGLPKDAKVVGVTVARDAPWTVQLLIESKEFPLITDGCAYPSFDVIEHAIRWSPALKDRMLQEIRELINGGEPIPPHPEG